MEENKEEFKISEARYVIVIPILITCICVVLDIVANISAGYFDDMRVIEIAENICRNIVGYFFPSILSIVIVMLWQKRVKREDIYGIKNDKVGYCVIITCVFSTCFIIYLMLFKVFTAVVFIIGMGIYSILIYKCLNEEIKVKNKKYKTQEDYLVEYCSRGE